MALTREQALKKAQEQMIASGGSGSGISESYIKELMGDTTVNTMQEAQKVAALGTGSQTANTGGTTSAAQKIYDLQKQQQVAALEQQRQRSLGALNAEQETVAPAYMKQRTQVGVGTQKAARNFSEFLAQRGLNSSGAAAQGEISQSVAEQGAMTGLREAEAGDLADIARRRTFAEQDFAAGELQAEYNRLIGLEQQSLQEQERARLEAERAQEREWQTQIETMGRYGADFAAEIERRKATNPNDPLIPYLEAARAEKVNNIGSAQSQQQAAMYEDAMDRWKMIGQVLPQDASILGVAAGTPTSDYRFKAANLELSRYKASRPSGSSGGSTSTSTSTKPPTIKEVVNNINADMESVISDLRSGQASITAARGFLESWNTEQKNSGQLSWAEREKIYQTMRDRLTSVIRTQTNPGFEPGGALDSGSDW